MANLKLKLQILVKKEKNVPRSPKAPKPSLTAFGGRLPLKNSGTSSAAVGLFLQAVPAYFSVGANNTHAKVFTILVWF